MTASRMKINVGQIIWLVLYLSEHEIQAGLDSKVSVLSLCFVSFTAVGLSCQEERASSTTKYKTKYIKQDFLGVYC